LALLQAHSNDFLDAATEPPVTTLRPALAPPAMEGTVIGPYIVRRELGRGGMGVVYLAEDTRLSRRVALKALFPEVGRDPARRERLKLEARAAAALSHPGIATVYALEEIGDTLYLSCEYVPGEPLRALLASGPLPIAQVVTIGAQLARALAAAHAAGVVHRDIKPENVVRTPSGVVKILDFGLARMDTAVGPQLTQAGVIVGTPAYMAPEQILGQPVDFRTDLFALGILLYELATGSNPFAAKSVSSTLAHIVDDDPPALSAVRSQSLPELNRIVETCLHKKAVDRYESTQDLVADFEQLEVEVAQLRHHSSHRSGGIPVADLRRAHDAAWWWEVHQIAISVIYLAMIYPAWYAQRWIEPPWGIVFLLFVLAPAAAGTTLRLHLRFIARHYAAELPAQLPRSQRATRICDTLFAVAQLAGAFAISAEHGEFAMLFVGAATALLVASFVIEPTTARAAFSHRSSK
jgi:predicted Ser/Thr protein kinase